MTLKLLKGPLKGVFDQIWIVSPTVGLQPVFESLHPEGIRIINSELTAKTLSKIIKHRNSQPEVHTLLILDDCGKITPSRELCQLFYLSRHLNTACLFLCQKITSLPTEVRSQIDCFISFSNTAHREKHALYNEIGSGAYKDFVQVFEDATNGQKYGTYVCSMQDGRPFYYSNCF